MKAALPWHTHVFAEEADPHGLACAAHVHGQGGLQEGVGHAGQVHVVAPALLEGLEPGQISVQQQDGVVVDREALCWDVGLLEFI